MVKLTIDDCYLLQQHKLFLYLIGPTHTTDLAIFGVIIFYYY